MWNQVCKAMAWECSVNVTWAMKNQSRLSEWAVGCVICQPFDRSHGCASQTCRLFLNRCLFGTNFSGSRDLRPWIRAPCSKQ